MPDVELRRGGVLVALAAGLWVSCGPPAAGRSPAPATTAPAPATTAPAPATTAPAPATTAPAPATTAPAPASTAPARVPLEQELACRRAHCYIGAAAHCLDECVRRNHPRDPSGQERCTRACRASYRLDQCDARCASDPAAMGAPAPAHR